ncbi:MAG TPA: 3-hydroxyacyl-CoA dehydrogenase NAD-binding domain-containing protein [Deinococcales bacterium]|nr:3-hydroxyacyl-CoA dehydrogenase NAD-binding domain-containing protein [Deinococcales bacterium]
MSTLTAVLGAGTMGAGIAQACATAGQRVLLLDVNEEAGGRALAGIGESLDRLVNRERLDAEAAAAAVGRIVTGTDYGRLAEADVVIEAVPEDLSVKEQVWREAAGAAGPDALLATNTSSLSVTQLAAFSGGREARFCGLHFFNPVAVLPLVEVVKAQLTTPETITRATAFVEALGKTPITCDDTPGFIVNRLLIPYLNDAVHVLAEGVASAADIDRAMKLGANMPLGPLALCDLVGLDVTLAAAESLHAEFQDPKFRVHPLLRQLVRAGRLGRKSGAGFYDYAEEG